MNKNPLEMARQGEITRAHPSQIEDFARLWPHGDSCRMRTNAFGTLEFHQAREGGDYTRSLSR